MAGNVRPRRDEAAVWSVTTRSAAAKAGAPPSAGPSRRNAAAPANGNGPSGKATGGSSTPGRVLRNERGTQSASPVKTKKKISVSPLRRSGRLEQNNRNDQNSKSEKNGKSDQSGRSEQSSKCPGTSGVKAGKKEKEEESKTGVVPSKRSAADGRGQPGKGETSADGSVKRRKFLDARSFRALYKPLQEKRKDTPVPSKKYQQGDSLEGNASNEKHNAAEGGNLEKGLVHEKDSATEFSPDGTRGKESTTDEGGACVSGGSMDPILENENWLYQQEQPSMDRCETTDGKGLCLENSKRSPDLLRKHSVAGEANDSTYENRQMVSKCSNSSQQSFLEDLAKQNTNGIANVGESCSLSKNGDRPVEQFDSASEEGSVAGDVGHDGGGVVASSRLNITKGLIESDASATSSENENFTRDIHSADADRFSLIERGNTEIVDGAIVENIIADKSTSFLPTIETNKDDFICPICKQLETQLFCKGKNCRRSYHLSCVDPPLLAVPPGIWLCLCCVRKKLDLGIYSISEGIDSIWDSKVVEVSHDSGLQKEKQYLVKYAGLAHVHNRWISEKEALSEAPDLVSKYNERCQNDKNALWRQEWCKPQRLLQKRLIMPPELIDEYFYCDGTAALPQCYYEWFVKWTGLGYEHATWELENSSFLNTREAGVLIKEYEARRNAAKEAYDPAKSDKVKQIRKKQFIKLSTLPDGFPVGFDISYLNSVNKLRECWHKVSNSVLANDQDRIVKVTLFISTLLSDVCRPFLVITSSDSISLWESELMRLMPTANFIVYDGLKDTRKVIRDLEFYEESGCVMFKVLLSHADAIVEDLEALDCLKWEVVVVDNCQLPQVSRHVDKFKSISAECRLVLLSGQLKESIVEYLNLLSFLDSEGSQNSVSPSATDSSVRFSNLALVKQQFEKLGISERKQDNSKFLEYWVPVRLSNVQLEQYCATLVFNSIILRSPSKNDQVGAFRDILLSTRKCCDHPFLVESSLNGSLTKGLPPEEHLDVGVHASGKLRLLDKILQDLKNRGLRLLVLFQVTFGEGKVHIGDILDDFLRFRFGAESYERVDSGLAMTKKQAALQKFNNKDSGRFVFLLENRACLPSIKLSAVDAVIIFGSDWNPLNDIKALQRISITSQFEQIKVFRLYSISSIEEMVLLHAKKDVILESNIPNISRSIGHSLLRWGATHLFDKLEEFHKCNSPASICLKASCEKPLVNDTLLEILQQLTCATETVSNASCSIISEVQQSGMAYSRNISLFGESEKVLDEDQHHLFWSKLLDGRHPQWRYITGHSQRARRKVQHFSEPPLQVTEENDETKRKRRKLASVSSDTKPLQAPPQDKTKDVPPVEVHVQSVSQVNDDHRLDTEGNAGLRNLQRSLYVRLKPELAGLCRTLQLSDDVKDVAEMYLEYIMNHHHVSQEPLSLLQAFMISLCWRAANFLRIKVDHKESLFKARNNFKFECNEEEAVSVYSKLRMLKKKFPRPTNTQSDTQSTPLGSETQRESILETCTSSEQQKISDLVGQRSDEIRPVKSEKVAELFADFVSNEHVVLDGNHCSNVMENLDEQKLEHIRVGSSLEREREPPPLLVTEVPFGGSFQSRAENGQGKSCHQVLHRENHVEKICSLNDISLLPAQPELQGNGQMPRSSQPPSPGHESATSAREENVQITGAPLEDAAPLPQAAEPSLVAKCGNAEVDLDVPNHEQEHAPDSAQSLDSLDGQSADAVGRIGHERFDEPVGRGGENVVSHTQPILKSSRLAESECDSEQAGAAMSTVESPVHCAQASTPSGLAKVPTQQFTHGESVVDEEDHSVSAAMGTPSVSCPIQAANQIVVANQSESEETCSAANQHENVVEPGSSGNPLLELHKLFPPENEQGQTSKSMAAANVQQPDISQLAAQSMPSAQNSSCQIEQRGVMNGDLPASGSNQANVFRESPSSENVVVPMQNQNVPLTTDPGQFGQSVMQDLSQPMTHVHTNSQQESPSQQPFQIHARLPPQGLHTDPLQNELLRISKEKELVNQACDDQKLKLRVECQIELEKVRNKYEVLIRNVDVEFAERKKMLDMIYSKVVLNRVLAEEFRSKFSENARAAAAKAAMQQGARPAAYSRPRFLQRIASVTSALPFDVTSPSLTSQRNHAITSAVPLSGPSLPVAPLQRIPAMLSTASINLPIPPVAPSQRTTAVPSAIRTAVPIPSLAPSQRMPTITCAGPTAVSSPSISTQRVPSPSSAATTAIPAPISTQRISPISSAVPPVVSIPSVPSLTSTTARSGPETQTTVPAPLQASIPMPPLQVVNHTSALFSSTNPSRPFVSVLPPPHGGPQGNILYRSPAPHLSSFRSPASIRLPSPLLQSGSTPSSQHSVTPHVVPTPVSLGKSSQPSVTSHVVPTPVSLQAVLTSRPLPSSTVANCIQQVTTSSIPAVNSPVSSVHDVPSSEDNQNEEQVSPPIQTSENTDCIPSDLGAFCVLSEDENQW